MGRRPAGPPRGRGGGGAALRAGPRGGTGRAAPCGGARGGRGGGPVVPTSWSTAWSASAADRASVRTQRRRWGASRGCRSWPSTCPRASTSTAGASRVPASTPTSPSPSAPSRSPTSSTPPRPPAVPSTSSTSASSSPRRPCRRCRPPTWRSACPGPGVRPRSTPAAWSASGPARRPTRGRRCCARRAPAAGWPAWCATSGRPPTPYGPGTRRSWSARAGCRRGWWAPAGAPTPSRRWPTPWRTGSRPWSTPTPSST